MTTIIAILIALGFLGSPQEFHELDQPQQDELTSIVIIDDVNN